MTPQQYPPRRSVIRTILKVLGLLLFIGAGLAVVAFVVAIAAVQLS